MLGKLSLRPKKNGFLIKKRVFWLFSFKYFRPKNFYCIKKKLHEKFLLNLCRMDMRDIFKNSFYTKETLQLF